jgi:membrane protein YdbS with pleckstrin-like domain
MPDEEIIFEGRIPFKAIHWSRNPLWLLLLGWNFGIISSLVKSLMLSAKITSERIVIRSGLLSKHEDIVEYFRVKDIDFKQRLLQRIRGIGTISLLSEDQTAPELEFVITDANEIKEQMRKHINQQRRIHGTMQRD